AVETHVGRRHCEIIRPQAYRGSRLPSRRRSTEPASARQRDNVRASGSGDTHNLNANLYTLFENHFEAQAGAPCLVIPKGPVVHYDELAAMSARIAHALVRAGCRPGDRVAAQVDKHWHALALYLACLRAGLVYLDRKSVV